MKSVITLVIGILSVNSVVAIDLLQDAPPKYTTIEYIEMNGYPAESHYVTTSDGYILNLHRIPTGRNSSSKGKVAFLEHGLWTTSTQWVIGGPETGLGFILADAGYDVWMGNTRGTRYSRNHTSLNPDTDTKFWIFSWHEIGIYDLPASIDYVLQETNSSSVYYVGHSQGTTTMYVMGSERPEYNNKIQVYVHLAPIAFMSHIKSPLFKFFSYLVSICPVIVQRIFGYDLFPGNHIGHNLTAIFCSQPFGTIICENFLFFLFGFSNEQTNITLVPEFVQQFPAGSSSLQITHYFQLFNSDSFRQYDYGSCNNLAKYGNNTPPEYDLGKVTAPGYIFYATNDWVSDYVTDVPKLIYELANCQGAILVPISSFNHIDYLMGIDVRRVVYSTLLEVFDDQ